MSSTSGSNSACYCSPMSEASVIGGTPITTGANANLLADSLGISPLYRQQDSARWQSAAQVYQSSRAHSPVPGQQFNFPDSDRENMCLSPHKLSKNFLLQAGYTGSPISLEDIGAMNRKRHRDQGVAKVGVGEGGPLELEAIAAVHELSSCVNSIAVSEILPRTADLIFVNVKTLEDHPFTLELTMKGWRVASPHSDSMNGDYTQLGLHTRYFDNARQILEVISPGSANHFNQVLVDRLKHIASNEENDASRTESK
uniref:GSKIP domain-containing protein n=1 Tax=Panagrolaimus sp. JU765 TaxID=591449 RepID=A0AC34QKP2_9BILA